MRLLADVMSFGWVLPASIAVGAGLGWLADRLTGLFPVLTIGVGILGFVAGVWQVYRESQRIQGGSSPREGPPR
jgi:F0F1-type ATP synthase assembly protein I